MNKNLSIIIPCYNCSTTLTQAVDSCYVQGFDHTEFEIVLVDDCSTDSTRKVMQTLQDKYNNIKVFHHRENKGGGATRNTAVSKTSNEVIFCLDSDDLLPKDTLIKMYDHLVTKKCDGVGLNYSTKFIGYNTNNIYRVDTFSYVNKRIPFESLFEKDGIMCPLYSVFMFTKNAFKIAGGYPEEHGFDTQGFAWRFLSKNLHAETCPETNYFHRVKAAKSYYQREYGNGNVNFNWQKVLVEHIELFNDEARRFILSFKCQDFTENIFDNLKSKGRILDDQYQDKILHGFAVNSSNFINCETPIQKNSPYGIFLRIRKKVQIILQLNSQIYNILKSTKIFFSEVRDRLASEERIQLVYSLILLRISRLCKINFESELPNELTEIDVVIPTLNKDLVLLETYLDFLKKNLHHRIKNIYIVAPNTDPNLKLYCKKHKITFIDEVSVLGYGKSSINYKVGDVDRSGWLFQQLLKLSGDVFVQSKNYLIVDSDTILINSHCFLPENKTVFFASSEWNDPYFQSFNRLFGFKNKSTLSFTAHMMLFNVEKLKQMKADITKEHHLSWDQAYITCCDKSVMSGISDYDTYAQWYFVKYPNDFIIKPFYNKSLPRNKYNEIDFLTKKYKHRYNSLSFHSYN